jgi:hypothetical protein
MFLHSFVTINLDFVSKRPIHSKFLITSVISSSAIELEGTESKWIISFQLEFKTLPFLNLLTQTN